MTWGKTTTGLPAELEAELAKVRAAAPPPQKIYKYLRRVYRLRRKLTKTSEWQDTLRDFGNAHHRQISTNYIRLIIQLTAPHVTTGMKHKYTAALQYALERSGHRSAIKDQRRRDPIVTQCRQECRCIPATVRDFGFDPSALRRPSRSGAMLVLVQVSSTKTSRSGAVLFWYFVYCARRRAPSGRSLASHHDFL
jgi:hypothetical protein